MNPLDSSYQKAFEFLVTHSIYPMMSKKGTLYFKGLKKIGRSDLEKKNELIRQLEIKTSEDCARVRREVQAVVSLRRSHRPIREWIKEERPREMLMRFGAEALPLSKLLAIILRTGKEGIDAEQLSKRLLNHFRTLRAMDSAPISEICKMEGIGYAKAVQIKAALELGKRLYKEEAEQKKRIKRADEVMGYVQEYYGPYLRDAQKEYFYVILLDIKNKPIHNIELSKGSLNATVVDPREIIKEATLRSAASVILVHNHPSGETEPSPEDMDLNHRIIQACHLVGIKVLDHIIIGKNREDYFSFANARLMG